MSTLPHLPTLLRKAVVNTHSRKEDASKQALSLSLPPVSPKISEQKQAPVLDSELQKVINNIQLVKEASRRQYENCLTSLRNIDRKYNLGVKKVDHNNSMINARISNRVSSLLSEVEELKVHQATIERKIKALRSNQEKTESFGFEEVRKGVQENFSDFEAQFTKSQSTLDTLFKGLEDKTVSLMNSVSSHKLLPVKINEVEKLIEDLKTETKSNKTFYKECVKEIENNLAHHKTLIDTRIGETQKNLENRINILEKRVKDGKERSEMTKGESENMQYQLKANFYKQIEDIYNKQLDRVKKLKGSVSSLNSGRITQITEIKARAKNDFTNLSKLRHDNMLKEPKFVTQKRVSLRPEINILKEKCEKLEAILEEKRNAQEPSEKQEDFKMYYRILDDGSFKMAIRMPDNSIYFG